MELFDEDVNGMIVMQNYLAILYRYFRVALKKFVSPVVYIFYLDWTCRPLATRTTVINS